MVASSASVGREWAGTTSLRDGFLGKTQEPGTRDGGTCWLPWPHLPSACGDGRSDDGKTKAPAACRLCSTGTGQRRIALTRRRQVPRLNGAGRIRRGLVHDGGKHRGFDLLHHGQWTVGLRWPAQQSHKRAGRGPLGPDRSWPPGHGRRRSDARHTTPVVVVGSHLYAQARLAVLMGVCLPRAAMSPARRRATHEWAPTCRFLDGHEPAHTCAPIALAAPDDGPGAHDGCTTDEGGA
ncbi:hypothetical protein RJ55_04398 [Drechmeria coniospora]|nr:hypothetical protein RJ55_04398 [Drechmeria coniospora]